MGKREHPFVWYYNDPAHFAGLINGWLFRGEGRLSPDDISDADRRALTRKGQRLYHELYRDLFKQAGGMALRLLIGVEEQGHVHYAMPVRIMDYDSSSYVRQKALISSRHRQDRDLKEDEFLSGFSREDRLLPVITLVLYCGTAPWDGALRLHELLDLEHVPRELMKYIVDYRIHVLDICHTPDEELAQFPSDIRTMFLFLKYKDDPVRLLQVLTHAEAVSRDTCEVIADCTGEPGLLQLSAGKEGEKINMCKAIDILVAEGEMRGEKRGEERGEKSGLRKGLRQGRKKGYRLGAAHERKNTRRERRRAEQAEARVRELERMLNL